MVDRIGRIGANAGVDRTAAEHDGIILHFQLKEMPTEMAWGQVQFVRSANTQAPTANPNSNSPRMLAAFGGPMDVRNDIMAAGMCVKQTQSVTGKTSRIAPETAREHAVGAIVGAVPGLGQFV